MKTPKLSSVLDGAFKAGVIAGIGALVWMKGYFVSTELYEANQKNQKELNGEIINGIRGDIVDIKQFMVRIEGKLDRVTKQTAAIPRWDWSKMNWVDVTIHTNAYGRRN
jgi:hypothetical protein